MIISLKMNCTVMQLLALSGTVERRTLGDSEMKIDPGMKKYKFKLFKEK